MRGVNKLVLEIRPDDERFEKAILFLKPDKIGLPQSELSKGAEELLTCIRTSKVKKHRSPVIFILSGIAAGSAISWALIFLIGLGL